MKCLFVINPASGTKTFQKKLDQFIGQLILKTDVNKVDTFFTKGKDDANHKAASLKKGQYDFVVAVGGDGTVNEVITGLVHSESQIPLAILAAGTVNDFATVLDLPHQPHDFVKMIKNFQTMKIDVGSIDDQCFVNVLSGGMFSDIGFQVTRAEKNAFGPLAYYLNGFKMLPQQLSICLSLHVEADENVFDEEASLFMITNSSHVGGFKDITPYASVQDGKLDLIIIKKSNVADILNIMRDYTFNVHQKNPMIHYVQAKHIKITCEQELLYDIDGEKGEHLPIDVTCLPGAINLLVKKKN